jgi:DNA-binding IclR family transcriptional regulator
MTRRTNEAPADGAAETSRTLDRGLRALWLLAEAEHPLTVAQIAGSLGLSRPVAYRLVATLEQHRLARRDAAGGVQVGLGLLHLTGRIHRLLTLAATPVLRSLSQDVGATAHLTVADGTEALAVAVVEPTWTDYHVAYRVGARHSLERGAAGRAILLARSPAADSPEFVFSAGELQSGAYGVAAPVRTGTGVEASIGVVAMSGLDVERAGARVATAAQELAELLG